jgi:hypothetical protein
VSVFAKRVVDARPRQLAQIALVVPESALPQLNQENAGIYFDWGPDQQAYQSHIEVAKPKLMPRWLLEAANA